MGTLVILGHSGDICCRKVQERLLGRARRVIYLQEDRLFPELGFAWEVQGRTRRGVVRFGEQEVEFGEIDAVLARFFGVPVSPAAYQSADGRYVSSEWNALAMAWTSELSCTVINRVRPELWYRPSMNVPALASLAPGAPFKRPRMMVTTRLDDARAFLKSCGGRVRYEPLTQPSAYVIEGENGLEKLGALAGTLPFHLAEVVEGDRFDVFVVGDSVVLTSAGGSLAWAPQGSVTHDSRGIAEVLGLTFCRLALVRAASGDWFCLGAERIPQLYDVDEDVQSLVVGHLAGSLAGDVAKERKP